MASKKGSIKPYMGRIPVAKSGFTFKDKKRYSRKKKHKKEIAYDRDEG